MAGNTATLKLRLQVDDNGAVKVIDGVGSSAKKAGTEGKRGFDKMGGAAKSLQSQLIKLGAAVGGLYALKKALDFSMETIRLASDLEETQNKFNVVFRGMTDAAESWSRHLRGAYAMSETESKAYLSSIQDLLVPTGMLREEAGELSNQFVKMAADLGSFNNRATAEVIADIQSALQGSSETMAKYGINVKQAKVEQEILRLGLASTKDEITDAHKAQAIYNSMMREGADAVGDMDRSADSYANQLKKAQANVEDMETAIGKELLPVATDLVAQFNAWHKANEGLLQQNVVEYIDGIKSSMTNMKEIYDGLPDGMVGAAGIGMVSWMLLGAKPAAAIAGVFAMKSEVQGALGLFEDWRQKNKGIFEDPSGGISTLMPENVQGRPVDDDFLNAMGYDPADVRAFLAGEQQMADAAKKTNEELKTRPIVLDDITVKADRLIKTLKPLTEKPDAIAEAISPEMFKDAAGWIESTRTPLEVYTKQLEEIEKLNKAGLFGEGDVGADNYARARQKALDDYVSANYTAAAEIDEIWENTRNRIQDALAGVFADMAAGELNVIKDYMAALGDASGEIFAARLSQAIMEGISSSDLSNDLEHIWSEVFGQSFPGEEIAAGIMGTLSAAISAVQSGDGGRMIGTGLGAAAGSFFGPMGMAMGASAGGTIGGLFGDSGPSKETLMMQELRSNTEALRKNTEALTPASALTDRTQEGIELASVRLPALEGFAPTGSVNDILSLAAGGMEAAMDRYSQSLQKHVMDVNQLSEEEARIYVDSIMNREKTQKHFADFWDNLTANIDAFITTVEQITDQLSSTVESDLANWASRLGTGPTAFEQAGLDLEKSMASLGDIDDQVDVLRDIMATMSDPADIARIQEKIDVLERFSAEIQNLGPAIEEFYAGNRADILTQMDRDLNPLSGLDQALADVTDRGESYRDQLVDNGMAIAEAEERTREWTEAMKDAVQAEMIGNTERDLTIRLLRAQGNEEAALNMEREGQIADLRRRFGDLSGPLEDIARQIWAIEDAARGLAAATSAVESARAAYRSAVQRQLSTAQAGQAELESRYESAKSAYVAAIQQKIDAENAANQSRINSLNASAQAAGRAASEVERMADTFGRIVDQIRDYRQNLLTGDSLIGVESRYKTARSEFETVVQGMYSSDLAARQEALSKLPQMAGTFLDASKGVNATPGGYQQDLARVLAVLNTAEGMAESGKSNAEQQLESALARQATLERQASIVGSHTSKWEAMLAEVENDQADTRSFEQIQQEYLDAKAAFDNSSFTTEIEYWQAELDRLDGIMNATQSVEAALGAYSSALVSAIAGGYDDLKGSFAAELADLRAANADAPGIKSAASFAGGGTVRGSASGYTIPTTFHGTEHITPDSQMSEVKEVLADARGVLIEIRDTVGAINLTALKSYRIADRVTQGENAIRTQAA